jgi:hypothetical protein
MMHCAAGGGRNKEQDAVELNDDHRRQRTESNQAETVEHRVAAPDAGRETHAEGGQQRCGNGRCDDAAGIESEADELRRRKSGQRDDDQIAGDQVVADRVAQDDPPDADHDREADTECRYHAQGQGSHAAAGNRLGLVSHGHQRRLGGDRREADAESEQHQPEERAAPGKIEGHRLAGRKDRRIEPLDEQREADEDRGEAADQRRRAVRHALDEKHLKDRHHDQRRRQISGRLVQELADDAQQRSQAGHGLEPYQRICTS